MLAEVILVHGEIGYKFCWLFPFEDRNQGTPIDWAPINRTYTSWARKSIKIKEELNTWWTALWWNQSCFANSGLLTMKTLKVWSVADGEKKKLPKAIVEEKWTIYLKATNLYRVWLQKSRHPKGCVVGHNASIDVTPWWVSMRHMDFSAMISKPPKVTTLAFGRSTSTQAQLQDLEGIVGPSM